MTKKLVPNLPDCPFCGGKAATLLQKTDIPSGGKLYFVKCQRCNANGPMGDQILAVMGWLARPEKNWFDNIFGPGLVNHGKFKKPTDESVKK